MSYSQKELQLGISIEMDQAEGHSLLAETIARDHLRADPRYYSKLQAAGLGEGVISVVIPVEAGDGQKKLTSSGIGQKDFHPLTSANTQAPKTRFDTDKDMVHPGDTPPAAIVSSMVDAEGHPVDKSGTFIKTNSLATKKTPPVKPDATEFFSQQIGHALQIEVPRRMEMIPANVSEGGAEISKKTHTYDGVKVDGEHAGLTTDMHGRFRIRAFDTRKANKDETPPMRESLSLKRLVPKYKTSR